MNKKQKKSLTVAEFFVLPDEEKAEAYKLLSDHDRFIWRTQYEPLEVVQVGGVFKITPEDRAWADKEFNEILKLYGIENDD